MSLSKTTYLYRIRVTHDVDGDPSLVETISRQALIEDGKLLSEVELPPVTVNPKTPEIIAAAKHFADVIAKVAADETAEAARLAAEAAAAKAAASAAEDNA